MNDAYEEYIFVNKQVSVNTHLANWDCNKTSARSAQKRVRNIQLHQTLIQDHQNILAEISCNCVATVCTVVHIEFKLRKLVNYICYVTFDQKISANSSD